MKAEKIRKNIERLTPGDPAYPALLKEIKGYPKELYYLGALDILQKRCTAVVGSRNTSRYGRSIAASLSRVLAEHDVAVVSGMARGIDTCAHGGALEAGGSTVAVLGCGVDICYPEENRALKEAIEGTGLLLSEYPPGTAPRPYHFPQRNRIISGISEVTVVVQAGNSSGALITADLAAEQGREVCAVPGNIDSQHNLGNNKLIQEGALPLINVRGILDVLGISAADEKAAQKLLSETELKIFFLLRDHGEMTVDEICQQLKKPPAYVSGIVTVMELKGVVFSALGKIFIANG